MKLLTFLLITLLLPMLCLAQEPPPVNVELESDGGQSMHRAAHERAEKQGGLARRVRSVQVEGRWAGKVQLPLAVGDVLTTAKISEAMNALREAITENSLSISALRSEGEIGVLYIEVDYDIHQPSVPTQTTDDTVGVTFRPYYLRLSLVRIGDNVLPIPRSPFPTFYENVPKPLLALNPTFGLTYDRAFGTALGGTLGVDLLSLSDPMSMRRVLGENAHLDVSVQGMKSLEEQFYRADIGLRYALRHSGTTLQEFSLHADYNGIKEPLGDKDHTRHAGVGRAGVGLNLAPNTRLFLDTGYRWTDDRVGSQDMIPGTDTSANEQVNRVLLDAIPRPLYGFLRAAVWEDNGWLTGAGGAYQRLVGRVGYAKEFPLMPNQTIGLELLAGGGKVWGDAPVQAHFFGGNSPTQFLYDAPSSAMLLRMPDGPLIRSFGEGEAGFRTPSSGILGGDAFWHVNLNLTLPIRGWSRALIPNEFTDIPDAQGNPTSLKQLLKRQIDVSGPSLLRAALQKEGLSAHEAEEKARTVFEEIRPATYFIIDDANLYSIKPLVMVDFAGLIGKNSGSRESWVAVGGGVQLTIVTAKFEAGYMHTLSGPTFGNRGNAFIRLVFQNLF